MWCGDCGVYLLVKVVAAESRRHLLDILLGYFDPRTNPQVLIVVRRGAVVLVVLCSQAFLYVPPDAGMSATP